MAAWALKGLNPAAEKQVRYIDVPYDLCEDTKEDRANHNSAIGKAVETIKMCVESSSYREEY